MFQIRNFSTFHIERSASSELVSFRTFSRSSHLEGFCKKGDLRNFAKFTGKHLCQSPFFNKVAGQACRLIKKETLVQVFSCEFCEVSKNTFSYRTPPLTASAWRGSVKKVILEISQNSEEINSLC